MYYKKVLQIAACLIVVVLSSNIACGITLPMFDPVTPIVIGPAPLNPGDAPRTPSMVRIEAALDTDLYSVYVKLWNAGTSVTVDIENVTAGESYQYFVSGNSSDVLPISGSSGYWTITFTLSDGSVYGGCFII
jgi:hypothetical protein